MGKPSGVTEPGGGLLSLGVMCSGLPWFHRAGLAGGRQGQFWAEIRDRSADESVAGTHLESELWRPVSSLQTGQSPTHASPWGPQLGLADWGGGRESVRRAGQQTGQVLEVGRAGGGWPGFRLQSCSKPQSGGLAGKYPFSWRPLGSASLNHQATSFLWVSHARSGEWADRCECCCLF